ncbi:MAG: rhomboid family intramembrane serine protease [Deltaproteobacteria bacterium]|nr:rhomboid family intramembrane serine protease [Deltaproteobacteria bacterium]
MTDDERREDEPDGEAEASLRVRMGAALVTVVLVVGCVAAFVATLGICAQQVEAPGAMVAGSWIRLEGCGPALEQMGALRLSSLWLDGSWWRLTTAGLLHGSWLHLILNIWSLWVVGEVAERTWGRARMVVLFAVSSVMGCLASAAWVEAPMVVGASAGIMGIAGALLVGRVLGRGKVATTLQMVSPGILGGWLAVLVGLGFFVDVIAQAGHLGGLAAGALLGVAWSNREPTVALAGRAGVMLAIAGLVLMARQSQGREGYYEYLGYAYMEREEDAAGLAAFEKALERRPEDSSLANSVAYGLAKAGVELGRAEELVMGALADDDENPDFIDTLGWIYCRRGDVEAGMVILREASEKSGGGVEEIEGHLEECAGAVVVAE